MLERISKHIEELAAKSQAIARQFIPSEAEQQVRLGVQDPLCEDEYERTKGLIDKYENRVLCLLTAECAAYCRFCTRRRMVSDIERGRISEEDIDNWVKYISDRPKITEVILSGGDPLVVPVGLLKYALERLGAIPNVKVLRIGTRVPVTAPNLIDDSRIRVLSSVKQPLYIGIHFEHPDELDEATINAVRRLRMAGAILYSQTVFLAEVNDDFETLYRLFTQLVEIGVTPYYIYRCDPVKGAEHFRVPFTKERQIMTELRKKLSGMACPTYVIDTPDGSGKIPVPLEFWDVDSDAYRDFEGHDHSVI
ncbi:MAG: KamA family radical SAM protein [Lentisphaerae bacterium]|nr:KamA family radical SAM protein [Lentisphaerota bacterium]